MAFFGKGRKNGEKKTPEDELDAYRKEVGKQYMDGLISDKEYEGLLEKKRLELGIAGEASPEPAKDNGPECPSCGAHVDPREAQCGICGTRLVPMAEIVERTESTPVDELNRICNVCGSSATRADTICSVCGGTLPEEDVLEAAPEEMEEPVAQAAGESVCQSCGAFVEADATECMICEAPIVAAVKAETVKEEEPDVMEPEAVEPALAEEPEIEETPAAEEAVCQSCGAFVEADATECMICESPIVAAAAVTVTEEVPPEPDAMETPVEEVPAEPVSEAHPVAEEKVCPACGAFAEPDATECMICDTPFGEAVPEETLEVSIKPEMPEPMPTNEDIDLPMAQEAEEPVPVEELVAEDTVILDESEIICPSCSKTIPADSGTCPECWTDLSLYVRCPSCSLFSPAGDKLCRECFAPLGGIEDLEDEPIIEIEDDSPLSDLDIPDEMEISEELREEMTIIETQEEQGKECLVCGAIFGPEDPLCPICGIEYGVEVEEPKMPDTSWDVLEVEVQPTIRTCPSCGSNVTGLDATEREINEGKWFYRGLVAIFTGIFFTSFSIWARGISAENASLGLNPPPTDVVVNLIGWMLVLVGFVFWFMSWRLHNDREECPQCGIESEPNTSNCINCGIDLIEPETEDEEAEEPAQKEDLDYLDKLSLPARRHADMPSGYGKKETAPEEPAPVEPVPEDIPDFAEEIPAEPEAPHFTHGEELPVEHAEHKKCPGCGIFVDLEDAVCPVCDTEFAPEPSVPTEDEEITAILPSRPVNVGDDELSDIGGLGEDSIDSITVPEGAPGNIECPSCGADLEAGTKACPVCEYPLG